MKKTNQHFFKNIVSAMLLTFTGMASADVYYEVLSKSISTDPWNWPAMGKREQSGTISQLWYGTDDSKNPTTVNDNYCVRLQSTLKVDAAGSYYFQSTAGDDQVVLYVDGSEVLRKDCCGDQDSAAAVSLTAGLHAIDARMCEGGGGDRLRIRWKGAAAGLDASTTFEDIPAAKLSAFAMSPGGIFTTSVANAHGLNFWYMEGENESFRNGSGGSYTIGSIKNTGIHPDTQHPDDLLMDEDGDSFWMVSRGSINLGNTVNTIYRFRVTYYEEDDIALFIDGNYIVGGGKDNPCCSDSNSDADSGNVTLTPGYHSIEVRFSDWNNGNTNQVQYCSGSGCTGFATIPGSYFYQLSPGPVAWYKADAGTNTVTNGVTVSSWKDSSRSGNNMTVVTGTPAYQANALNFNPTIDFQDETLDPGDSAYGLPYGQASRTVFAVVKPSLATGATDNGTITGYGQEGYAHAIRYYDTTSGTPIYNAALMGYNWGSSIYADNMFAQNETRLVSFHYENSAVNVTNNARLYRDATNVAQASSQAWSVQVNNGAEISIGQSPDHDSKFNGQIAEVIYYPWDLTGTEFQRVNSYLAIKYGLVLASNYLDSTGATLWTLGSYDNEITGIGRDDASALDQRVSRSQANADASRIILALDAHPTAANNDGTNRPTAFANNRTFAMAGRDSGAFTWTATYGVTANRRMARLWKLDTQGSISNLKIMVPVSAMPANPGSGELSLVMSSDTTFNNLDTVIALATCATDATYYCATIPTPVDGYYFTYAYAIYSVQTITPTQPAATQTYGTPFNVSATATSGLPVSVSASGGCSGSGTSTSGSNVSISVISGITPCTIDYSVSANITYRAATLTGATIAVQRAVQPAALTLTPSSLPGPYYVGVGFNVAASSPAGAVTITASSSGVCGVSVGGSNSATIVAQTADACTVYYTIPETNNYLQKQSSLTATILKQNQTISFPTYPATGSTPPQTYSPGGTFVLTAATVTPSGFAPSYTSTTTGVCTLTGAGNNVVQMITAGICTINASQAGNAAYNLATTVPQDITINKAGQTITVSPAAPATARPGTTFAVAATASSGNPVTITASGCTNTSGTISALVLDVDCVLTYSIAESTSYNAATDVVSTTQITKVPQTITITQNPLPVVARSTPFTVSAVSSSNLTVTISKVSGDCVLTGGAGTASVTYNATGVATCVISYAQAGNATYAAATTLTSNVDVNRTTQTITVTTAPPASRVYPSAAFTVAATASSGLTVSISVSGACTMTGGSGTAQVTMSNAIASCSILYNQGGSDVYKPASQVTNVVKDGTKPVLVQVTPITSPASQTPSYTFSSTETGTIYYGGSCSSANTFAVVGNNTVTFDELAVGTYANCTITVVDSTGNYSDPLAIPSFTTVPKIVAYVKPASTGTGDCSSWANACGNIQTAINFPQVTEVWLMKGTYRPTLSINLKAGVDLIGGFEGTENNAPNRRVTAYLDVDSGLIDFGVGYGESTVSNLTIISGDTTANDVVDSRGLVLFAADVVGTNLSPLFKAENLTVAAGKEVNISGLIFNAGRGAVNGGAILVSNSYVAVDTSQFILNKGATGGAVSVEAGGKFTASDTVFLKNESTGAGGAIASTVNTGNVVSVQSSVFESNVGGTNGGAIHHATGKLSVLNTTFFGNSLLSTTGSGGAINLDSLANPGSAYIKYATLMSNAAGTTAAPNGRGGAISINSGAGVTGVVRLANSLILDNKGATGANIADLAKITDGGYNIVGFNGISGVVKDAGNTPTFMEGTSTTAPTVLLSDIVEVSLANNGGYTASLKLKDTSYARDKIPNTHADCESTNAIRKDQRGYVRPDKSGYFCDVGAVELDKTDPCNDPNRQKGFFVMTYPAASATCVASGNVNVKLGLIQPFYLMLLVFIGLALEVRRHRMKQR